ncbi:hypothetical protein Tsubulata_015745 [Turnera subulata]|uniref:Receptor-like serine/threonine-protein kinase n=1 Tax=Turnera subulata TaxID=218843 RepID=A0A9Q0F6H7_9ROSI|nr:hypothetical protein Tsubulata_015745 [Turnera subulata]
MRDRTCAGMVLDLAFPIFFLILLLPCSLIRAQNTGAIGINDSVTAGDKRATPWLSPSQDFAFGFRQLANNKDLYLLAIWYNKIPDRTIVWFANGADPAPTNSKVQLTAQQGLVLTTPQGGEIWTSGISMGEAAQGFLNDTGNLVISNSRAEKLWQSFDDPTDTLLPTQTMEQGGRLSSRLSETNYSQGRFQFRLLHDGNAVLNTNNLPTGLAYDAYFWSNTYDTNVSNAGIRVVFNESGYLFVLRANDERVLLTQGRVVSATENYHRATLNFDGVFVLYSHPKNFSGGSGNWSIIRTMPANICTSIRLGMGSGPCGFNSICTLDDDMRPICRCPHESFSLLDPEDKYGGCKPHFPTQYCDDNYSADNFDLVELTNTDWPQTDYETYSPYNIEECTKACLQDCFCNVAIFGEGTCWKKKLPLSFGRQDTSVNRKAFIKVRKGNFTLPPASPFPPFPYPKKKEDALVLPVLLGTSVFANFLLVGLVSFCFAFFYRKKLSRNAPPVERSVQSNLRCFSFKELAVATDGFTEELGRGSFGTVYKGFIELGARIPVAVKKLDRVVQESEKEFKTEVEVIGQTYHKNLVRLIGFCEEGEHRLLVYEFLSSGSLSSFLFGAMKLSWNQRTEIALGIARGLLYLHEECSTQIIHCDIKPQNILLDEYYDAKIADFGLAKLLFLDQSKTYTNIRGTKGYVASEWFRNMPITAKVDVYSFGVLLLEIVSCQKSVETERNGEGKILTYWAYDCYQEGRIEALVENDEEALNDMRRLDRFVTVAIWCIQEDPTLRPTMKMVMLMLEDIIQVPVPPCPFPFTTT